MARHTQKQRGGSRHTTGHGGGKRRATRKASNWAKAVTSVYKQMKRENPEASLKDAMQRASQLRRQGQL